MQLSLSVCELPTFVCRPAGREKLASVPSGGPVAAGGAAAPAADAGSEY